MLDVRDEPASGNGEPLDRDDWMIPEDRFAAGWDDPWVRDVEVLEDPDHPFSYPAGLP